MLQEKGYLPAEDGGGDVEGGEKEKQRRASRYFVKSTRGHGPPYQKPQ